MKRYDLIVIGAGPAGLSAAIEAASCGMKVIVYDENARPGGQLFKQIHKFFGSKEHKAKERGFRIGEKLLSEAAGKGVEVMLQATVMGLYENKEITVMIKDHIEHVKANSIIIATGASENMLPFKGWTLPGVIGAGAAQTLMNLHGVKPGNKILMVGSGNVGLVVGFQILQAGCSIQAVIDASPKVGGYGVHAAKLSRTGVPFYMSHTIKEAHGTDHVTGATIVEVDNKWQPIPDSEKYVEVDTICIAVGLSPMSQLAKMGGCAMEENLSKGGLVAICNEYGETSIEGIYCAGDVAGIEEASSAMIQGRISGAAAAEYQGFISRQEMSERFDECNKSLSQIREGMFAPKNKGCKDLSHTDEGIELSKKLLRSGYLDESEIGSYPGVPDKEKRKKGIVPVIECSQNIPCNPCQDACPKGCIKIGSTITKLPAINEDVTCSGCGMCVVSCPGQAIFLVDECFDKDYASVSIPYEFLPLPSKGDKGIALDRSGNQLGEAQVVSVKMSGVNDETAVLTMKVPLEWSMKARFFKPDL